MRMAAEIKLPTMASAESLEASRETLSKRFSGKSDMAAAYLGKTIRILMIKSDFLRWKSRCFELCDAAVC